MERAHRKQINCNICSHFLYLRSVFRFLSNYFLLLSFWGKNCISFCCPPHACLQPRSSVAGAAVWGHTVNCIRELVWLQSKRCWQLHPEHHSPGCFDYSFLVIYFACFPPKCMLISLFHWHFGEKSLRSSLRQNRMGTALVPILLLHCNLGSLKWSVLTEILSALHCVLLEMFIIFGWVLK